MSSLQLNITNFIQQQRARRSVTPAQNTNGSQPLRHDIMSESPDLSDNEQTHSERTADANQSPVGTSATTGSSTASRKRAAEVMAQSAQRVAQRLRLKDASAQALLKFSKTDPAEREIVLMATILQVNERLELVQPNEALWKIPSKLYEKIELYTADVLLCPYLSAYRKVPTKIVLDTILRHPSWGYTLEDSRDKTRRDVVTQRIQGRLSDRRNGIKAHIGLSLGREPSGDSVRRPDSMHIIALVEAAMGKVRANVTDLTEPSRVTLAMCARFAFLRKAYREDSSNAFWKTVDATLKTIREEFAAETGDMLSSFFTNILNEDQLIYGVVDVENLAETQESALQAEISDIASGTTTAEAAQFEEE